MILHVNPTYMKLPPNSASTVDRLQAHHSSDGTEVVADHSTSVKSDSLRESNSYWVVATQIFFIFTPIPGEMIQFDVRIFFRWVGSTTKQVICQAILSEKVTFLGSCEFTVARNQRLESPGGLFPSQ